MSERYTIEDVPAWMVARGVGHIVAGQGFGSGWARWACDVQTPYGSDDILKEVPARICRKCRAVLDEARSAHLKTQAR